MNKADYKTALRLYMTRLRREMQRARVPQRELARILDINPMTVQNWLKQQRTCPDLVEAAQICRVLGISLDKLCSVVERPSMESDVAQLKRDVREIKKVIQQRRGA